VLILKHGRSQIFPVSPDGRAHTTQASTTETTSFGETVIVGQQMHDSFVKPSTTSSSLT